MLTFSCIKKILITDLFPRLQGPFIHQHASLTSQNHLITLRYNILLDVNYICCHSDRGKYVRLAKGVKMPVRYGVSGEHWPISLFAQLR